MAYSTGEVKISISNERDVTLEQVVNEATTIWKKCRKEKLPFGDLEAADQQMEKIRKEHPEFCKSYPIVLRYICQMQEYKPRAFRKYLLKIQQTPWKNQEEYLDSQADYVCLLYQETKARWNRTDVENIRRNVRAMLQKEHDTFMMYAEEFDKEVNTEESLFKERATEAMREFYAQYGEETLSVPIRAQSDLAARDDIDLDALSATMQPDTTTMSSSDLLT